MKTSIFTLFLFFSSIITYSQTPEKNFIDQNYIEVTGTAEIEIIPNEIEITISINDKDFKTKQAFSDFEKSMIEKLKEIGISINDELSVMNMNSSLKVLFIGKDKMYSTRQYKVIVHDATKANEVFFEMGKLDITTIAVTRFDHSEIEKYRLQVKTEAIKAAKDKAMSLTSAIGQSIGRALYINEVNFDTYKPNVYANMMYKSSLESDFEQIEKVNFQKIKLSYSVLVKFELK